MGCGASSSGGPGGAALKGAPIAPSGSARQGSVRRSAWEHSRSIGSQQWTAHSTMTAAKQAMAQGMPEPPDSYFQTQDRLANFFLEHGEQRIVDPREVILEPNSKLDMLYMIEEGTVTAEKDIRVMKKPISRPKQAADGTRHSTHGESMADKGHELQMYKKSSRKSQDSAEAPGCAGDASDADPGEPQSASAPGERSEALAEAASEKVAGIPEESTLVERVKLTTLERDEMLAEVPFIEGTPLEVRYKADAEGAVLRALPRKTFLEELHRDPLFAGAIFKNMALTLAIKCEELCWALEEMATEASSVAWRASWRMNPSKRSTEFSVSTKVGKKLQIMLGVPDDEELQHSTHAVFDHKSIRVHGNFLVFSKSLCFYTRVFGMTVKKVLPVSSIVSVLRDTPATQDMESAIEVACMEEALIFSAIPDLTVTCEAINEMLELNKRARRGSVRQVLEPSEAAREAARNSISSGPTSDADFGEQFVLSADEWLDFLQHEANCCVYNKGDRVVSQKQDCDSLFQIARGCIRVEKTTHLGDGTVVISRLGPPAVFGEFFFLMGTRVTALTSFICDVDGTELYVIKPSSLQPYIATKPLMPVCLYKYLAASMARKYRVLSATAGFGLARAGDGAIQVSLDDILSNTVFASFYSRFLRIERKEKVPWLVFWQGVEEFRVMPRSIAANKAAFALHEQYLRPGAREEVPISEESRDAVSQSLARPTNAAGATWLVLSDLFDTAQREIFEELRVHTYDKFSASSYFTGVTDLKLREKEFPTVHHFYFMKKLGTGSFGEVFAVRKKDSHKRYAMKVMSKAGQAQMSRRWAMYIRIEGNVMASLNHPFLVNLNYCFQTPQSVFMVLDLVLGGDMDKFQKRFKASPPTDEMLRFVSTQLVAGIEYMHSLGVIHRDMKPPNVLIDWEGNLRITDFGLSLHLNPGEVLYDRTGTKPYMAPELHSSSKSMRRGYGFPVDWFAIGVTLWEFVAGGRAMPPPVAAMLRVIREQGKLPVGYAFEDLQPTVFDDPANSYMSHLCDAAKDFLLQLMHVNPAERIATKDIKGHPFFAEINWPSVSARTQRVPWSDDVLQELSEKRLDESIEERKTAAQALGTALSGPAADTVSNFDFVSPRAIMEEYIENVYQLRSNCDE